MIGTPQRRRIGLVLSVAVAGVLFQVIHLGEHTVQMAMWVRHPQRAPWMSPWAHEGSLRLGQVDAGRSSETTIAVARGMEYLHLLGNLIFLCGVVALWILARSYRCARSQTRRALVVQGLHVGEHVVLVTTLVLFGRPVGMSTGFGLLEGTQLSTFRVWWHGGVNLLATAVCVGAIVALWSGVKRRVQTRAARRIALPVVATLSLPVVLALAFGQSAGPAAADHSAHETIDERVGFHLVDVAVSVGLDVESSAFHWDVTMDPVAMMGGGVCWIDVDRDGWLDLFVTDTWSDGEWGMWNSAGALPTTRIFRNIGGTFEEYTSQWSAGFAARANGCVAADFDSDGFTDLYVTTARENLLLWNSGGAGFEEGAGAAGVDAYGWHTGVAAGDIDGDGRIDLAVAGYADLNAPVSDASTGFPNTFAPVRDLIYLNKGPDAAGRPVFDDIAGTLGVEPAGAEYGLGVVLVDVDVDGDLDLYVANDTQPNRLYLNESSGSGGVRFRDVSAQSGADDPNSGMGIAAGDTNGDALPDLLVTNIAGQGHASLRSVRPTGGPDPAFSPSDDSVHRNGLDATGWGASFGDLDRDGQIDVLVATGAIPITTLSESSGSVAFFCGLDRADGFRDASADAGLDSLDARNGRGLSLADYDNDGDLDAVVTSIGQPLALLENRGSSGQWISIDPGPPDPGMRVVVELSDGTTIERQAMAGGSWLSSQDPRLHVGYADGVTIDRVVVTNSAGDTLQLTDVASATTIDLAG